MSFEMTGNLVVLAWMLVFATWSVIEDERVSRGIRRAERFEND